MAPGVNDPGTTVMPRWPTAAEAIALARKVLSLPMDAEQTASV
jgi:hypothetical protein